VPHRLHPRRHSILNTQQPWQHFLACANLIASHRFTCLSSVDQRLDNVILPNRSDGYQATRFTAVYGINRRSERSAWRRADVARFVCAPTGAPARGVRSIRASRALSRIVRPRMRIKPIASSNSNSKVSPFRGQLFPALPVRR
ncbi:MAG TPA: hypothetical protein PLB97_07390, partial [Accumulibacter sp.]|nr:hypothetical protein [Accumulibacter sp.]